MKPLAALTGGSGFLGRSVIRALDEAGWRVRMLARSQPTLPELADVEIELAPGDLGDEAALSALISGADAVIHIAGLVKAARDETFFAVNEGGAGRVAALRAALAPEAPMVLVSSLAARRPDLSAYAASKRAGEDAARAAGPPVTVLRPAAIYGAHDRETLKVLKLAALPVQPLLNAPDARVAMIDVRDAARAVAAAAAASSADRLWELTDERVEGWRWDDLAAAAARAVGRPPRQARLPAAILRAAGVVGGLAAKLTGSAEMLTPGKVREILHHNWSGDPALRPPADLWRPQVELEAGLIEMVDWAAGAGLLRLGPQAAGRSAVKI